MRKIGIITINDYNNYGNRLQNYATQEVLSKLGFEVDTIVIENSIQASKDNGLKRFRTRINKLIELPLNKGCSIFCKKVTIKLNDFAFKKLHKARLQSFKDFTNSYISETNVTISNMSNSQELLNSYDYFITGSDQVWNPHFRKGNSIDFLTFAPSEKRIAYAPSFGVSEIPQEFIDKYEKWLSEIPRLSVREHAGAKIIKKLTNRDAVVLLDPTLMLTKEDWLSISKSAPRQTSADYLLTYFLGRISNHNQVRIRNIAKKNNLKIINLADLKDVKSFITGPSEFIDYINSAKLFCTDSFHGVVFSILLKTPFIVFNRNEKVPSMNSRLETLLSTFGLESRLAQNVIDEQVLDVDYSHIDPILGAKRKEALDYLKESLDCKKVN